MFRRSQEDRYEARRRIQRRDTPRLVYADWLQEQSGEAGACPTCKGKKQIGPNPPPTMLYYKCRTCNGAGVIDHFPHERAEFIRAQIRAERSGTPGHSMRLWELLHHSEHWFASLCKAMRIETTSWGVCYDDAVAYESKHHANRFTVRCGFPNHVSCGAVEFCSHIDAIRAEYPVRSIKLTTPIEWFPLPDSDVIYLRPPASRSQPGGLGQPQLVCTKISYSDLVTGVNMSFIRQILNAEFEGIRIDGPTLLAPSASTTS